MKKIFLLLSILIIIFSSCQKRKCQEQQQKDLATLLLQFQAEVSNTNLTAGQVAELTARYQANQQKILSECN
ncbi:MAG: hypothetical protein ABI237_05875 [Ginsengibacter sp.]